MFFNLLMDFLSYNLKKQLLLPFSTIRRCGRWQVGDWGGGGKNFQRSVKGMSLAQADGNSWKGRAKHITSLLYSTKHVRSPDWPGNHRLHTADKKREMPRNKMTL